MNPQAIAETTKVLVAAGMNPEQIAHVLASSMNNVAAETVHPDASTSKPVTRKVHASKRNFTLTADQIEVTDDTKRLADECIGYAISTGETKTQMKVKAAELFNVSGILECKDQEQALIAWDKLLTASVAVPEKIENRNNGKMVPARFTSGPQKGKIKWTVSTSLSALFERGREMIQAFLPMRDDAGYTAAEEKLCPGGVWVTKAVIRSVAKQYKPKQQVDGVKQCKTNALALKGVVNKYITKKADAKKAKAEIAPILKEITDILTKLSK